MCSLFILNFKVLLFIRVGLRMSTNIHSGNSVRESQKSPSTPLELVVNLPRWEVGIELIESERPASAVYLSTPGFSHFNNDCIFIFASFFFGWPFKDKIKKTAITEPEKVCTQELKHWPQGALLSSSLALSTLNALGFFSWCPLPRIGHQRL